MAAVTRLGLGGGPAIPYGDFTLKIQAIIADPVRHGLMPIPLERREEVIEVVEEIAVILKPQRKHPITEIPAAKLPQIKKLAKIADLNIEEVIIIMNLL